MHASIAREMMQPVFTHSHHMLPKIPANVFRKFFMVSSVSSTPAGPADVACCCCCCWPAADGGGTAACGGGGGPGCDVAGPGGGGGGGDGLLRLTPITHAHTSRENWFTASPLATDGLSSSKCTARDKNYSAVVGLSINLERFSHWLVVCRSSYYQLRIMNFTGTS